MNWDFFKKNRAAIQFLLIFFGLYFILNTLYGFFIQHYYPSSDPFTQIVTSQVVWILSTFDSSITMYISQFDKYIAIANDRENMISVYERHNGLNVLIAYLSFIVAFKGPLKLFVQFAALGVVSIYMVNLGRVCLLYAAAFYFPEHFDFFQKYLFAGIIYCLVFGLWYWWVKRLKNT